MGASETAAALALAKQLGVPFASAANKILRMEERDNARLRSLVPEGYARSLALVPLFIDGPTLAVALADPSDEIVLAELRALSKLRIQPFVAARSEIVALIDRSYR